MPRCPLIWSACLLPACASAQQVSDTAFRFANDTPAFEYGGGPVVCIDEAHVNFHTADGRYRSFAELLRADGYVVERYSDPLTVEALDACGLLVIANPLAEANREDWSYPHPSAFDGEEMRELALWVRSGGRFLLFADHAPIAAASHDLGAVFGVIMTDAYVDAGPGPDLFRWSDGTLATHPIREGRSNRERVDSVLTFTGQAMHLTEGWEPLLVLGPGAVARINTGQIFQPQDRPWPEFSVAGMAHGAAREWGEGRAVFMGEAAMCSAQLSGPEQSPMGMNHPTAAQNPQFCLNVVRWLTGVIEP